MGQKIEKKSSLNLEEVLGLVETFLALVRFMQWGVSKT